MAPQGHLVAFFVLEIVPATSKGRQGLWWATRIPEFIGILPGAMVKYVIYDVYIWVCLKIVYPFLPNGFADHYPYEKWL